MILRKLRTIKQPCEIEAIRKAEAITKEGILAMMKVSRPGLYEYQYKAGIRARTVAARHRRNRLSAHHFRRGK